ncbi:hypothetical protein E2C01_009243 [Portunus trituberculatus]|uniref:Uncharacterized protein n=1 Tax=Portunus trituberculatus TaxID=210409 RepID=A0A5B7D434_PORTR|nr:hypothetical protein [Portunus trituberculatus]
MEVRRLMATVFTILIPTYISEAVKKLVNTNQNEKDINLLV